LEYLDIRNNPLNGVTIEYLDSLVGSISTLLYDRPL